MLQGWLSRAFKFRNNALRQHFAEFHAPLVKRIDLPDYALREHRVLIERNQFAEHRRRELVGEDGIRRAVAFEHAMRYQPIRRTFGPHLLRRLAECQRLTLREHIGHEHVMMPAKRVQRLTEADEVARDQPRSLMDQLIERVLAIGAGLAPINRTGGIGDVHN